MRSVSLIEEEMLQNISFGLLSIRLQNWFRYIFLEFFPKVVIGLIEYYLCFAITTHASILYRKWK